MTKKVLNPYLLSIIAVFTSIQSPSPAEINTFITQENDIKKQIILVKMGKNDQAIKELNQLIKDGKKNAVIYHYLARAYGETNSLDQSIKFFNKSIETKSGYPKPYLGLALIKGQQGKMNETLELLNKAIELNPYYAEAYSNRGVTKGALNDNYGAIEDFNTAIKLNPLIPDFYINRGITRELTGDLVNACEDWEIAGSLGQNKAKEWHSNQCKDAQIAELIRQNKLIISLENKNEELSKRLLPNDKNSSVILDKKIPNESPKRMFVEIHSNTFKYYLILLILLISIASIIFYNTRSSGTLLVKKDIKKDILKDTNISKSEVKKNIFYRLIDTVIKYFDFTMKSIKRLFKKIINIVSFSFIKV